MRRAGPALLHPVECLVNLQRLYLGPGDLEDLTPLSGLLGLEDISIPDNAIKTLAPLSRMENLVRLNFNNNNIESIADVELFFNQCGQLQIADNPVPQTELDELCEEGWAVYWAPGESCNETCPPDFTPP